jgi:hypothetical protein
LSGDPAVVPVNLLTGGQLLDLMRERARAGLSVSLTHPEMKKLERRAKRLFGSWRAAREEAGCPSPRPYGAAQI